MQVQRVVRSFFAVVVLSVIVAQIDLSAAHAQPPTLCSVGQCFDTHARMSCTGRSGSLLRFVRVYNLGKSDHVPPPACS